ncbi:gluconate 2-dehydrogenase subunit 3 family protein [Arenibacter sp. M-2]|uniref:gluconate 2-dehydrogenase subunit 3 family protein n=1 Tax=unclassified Arenibacter TaxID=2615047 RepID=UPI000D75EF5B|nr:MULTISPECIES: gluconate 2-dehydrogenase subunit 3 family protein [unclassified Arenibacter]MDL5510326.1 gluconate 2-dehydrogenase subunit 3 family protein [Arenibacter sp. M-2]PXX31187.1 gluconate 2-dehydrogenase subunit 3-like protein [Arenibacter sp. ARW7G5Y1]
MERREALVNISWLLKSAFLAPTLLTALQSCQEEVSETNKLLVLNDYQNDLIKTISDTIIPRTTTPSASDVKVNYFIDLLLKDVFEKDVQQKFLKGLIQFDETCKSNTGKSFLNLTEKEQHDYLKQVDEDIMSKEYGDLVPFYYSFKVLTIKTYFSTKEGALNNLNYNPVPGPYQGEIELKKEDKITIGNRM